MAAEKEVVRVCVECKRPRRVELTKTKHGFWCVRCARIKVFKDRGKTEAA